MFNIDGKYAGRSRAVVLDNVDPKKRGRIRVNHPILGETVWIDYLKNPGQFDVPNIGDIVYVEADCGDIEFPIAHGCIVKGKDGDLSTPEAFQRSKPTNRGLYTPDGHLLELDDGKGPLKQEKGVRLTTSGGIKVHALEGTPAESKVLIEMPNGIKLEIDGTMDSVKLEIANGHSLEMSPIAGVKVVGPQSSLEMVTGKVTVKSAQGTLEMAADGNIKSSNASSSVELKPSGDVEVKNSTASMKLTAAGKVSLGGPTAEVVDVLHQFLTEISTDVWSGFGAPAGKAALYAALAAKLATIKS